MAVYNHYKRLRTNYESNDVELGKSNIFTYRPLQVAENVTAQTLARRLNVPSMADATTLRKLVMWEKMRMYYQKLLQNCEYDTEKQRKALFILMKLIKLAEMEGASILEMFQERGATGFIKTY